MVRRTDRPAMTIAVDLGRKARKQTNKTISNHVEKYFLNTPYTGLLMGRHKDIYCFLFCSVHYDDGRNRN